MGILADVGGRRVWVPSSTDTRQTYKELPWVLRAGRRSPGVRPDADGDEGPGVSGESPLSQRNVGVSGDWRGASPRPVPGVVR